MGNNFVDSIRNWFANPVETYIELGGRDGLAIRLLGLTFTTGKKGFSAVLAAILGLGVIAFWSWFLWFYIPETWVLVQPKLSDLSLTLEEARRTLSIFYVFWFGVQIRRL